MNVWQIPTPRPCLARFHTDSNFRARPQMISQELELTYQEPESTNPCPFPGINSFQVYYIYMQELKRLGDQVICSAPIVKSQSNMRISYTKGQERGGSGGGEGCEDLKSYKKNNNPNLRGGREIPTLHNRKAHQKCSSAGHNYFIIGNGSGPNGSCQVVHNPNRVFVSLSKVCLHLAQRLLKVVCHPLCQLNLLICASHESVHNLLTWCPVLKISKLFCQVTCTCFLSQFIWFQSMVFF